MGFAGGGSTVVVPSRKEIKNKNMNDSKLNLFLLGLTILVLFFAFYYDRKDKQERLEGIGYKYEVQIKKSTGR